MANIEKIWQLVDDKKQEFFALSDRVWETPETNYSEFKSVAAHAEMLEQQGFSITRNVAGIPTAIMGEAGEGGPVIAILGEYDALPGLSQAAGATKASPLIDGGNGHGCGHNLLGSGSLLAATAVKDFLAANGLKGRVRYYGCPAEEGGGGKAFMARRGAFADVDVAISWHPNYFNMVWDMSSLANVETDFTFSGRSAHAAAAPHLGRSALDAIELMNVGVNYLREHMPSSARIHYAMLDGGGMAPNVVQAKAKVRYRVRAENQTDLVDLVERVRNVAQGAALMTGTTVQENLQTAVAGLLRNAPLEKVLHANLLRLGSIDFDDRDRALAEEFQATLSKTDVASGYTLFQWAPQSGTSLDEKVHPLREHTQPLSGSTDVGDVSRTVPTSQIYAASYAVGTPFHTWQMTGQGKTAAAHKSLAYAAKVMAGAALDILSDGALLSAIKEDFRRRSEEDPFIPLLPADLQPRLVNEPA